MHFTYRFHIGVFAQVVLHRGFSMEFVESLVCFLSIRILYESIVSAQEWLEKTQQEIGIVLSVAMSNFYLRKRTWV